MRNFARNTGSRRRLAADPDHVAIKAYGVWGEKEDGRTRLYGPSGAPASSSRRTARWLKSCPSPASRDTPPMVLDRVQSPRRKSLRLFGFINHNRRRFRRFLGYCVGVFGCVARCLPWRQDERRRSLPVYRPRSFTASPRFCSPSMPVSVWRLFMNEDIARLVAPAEDARINAYEMRIADLRTEIDRLNSRQYAREGDINLQIARSGAAAGGSFSEQQQGGTGTVAHGRRPRPGRRRNSCPGARCGARQPNLSAIPPTCPSTRSAPTSAP